MAFGENIKDSLKILFFNETSLIKVSNNASATGYGFLTLVIAGIAMWISSFFSDLALTPIIFFVTKNFILLILIPIALIIGVFIEYSIYHFIAKFILGGQATGIQYFRSLSNSFIIFWFTFVPFIGVILQYIAWGWLIIINIFILHKVHKLSLAKAIILGLVPIIIVLVLVGAIAYFGSFDLSGSFSPQ